MRFIEAEFPGFQKLISKTAVVPNDELWSKTSSSAESSDESSTQWNMGPDSSVHSTLGHNPDLFVEGSIANDSSNWRGGAERYELRKTNPVDYAYHLLPNGLSTSDEPTLKEAFTSPECNIWRDAIQEEFSTLHEAKTWKEENTVPSDAEIIPSGIILRLKRNESGNPSRFKARLVCRGNMQKGPISNLEKYAPVACIESVRLLLPLSVCFG